MNERSPDHERHDPLLIAAHAAGDLTRAEDDRAAALLLECLACATLAGDLRALAAAVRDLPAPTRRRDFTISPLDARRLRRGGWRRFVDVVRGDTFRLARPVGAAFASLGFAGLVFASMTGGMAPSGAGAAPGGGPALYEAAQPSDVTTAAGVDDGRAVGGQPSAATLDAQRQVADPDPAGAPEAAAAGEAAGVAEASDAMVVVSGSLFIVGIGLFGLRWTADRLGDG